MTVGVFMHVPLKTNALELNSSPWNSSTHVDNTRSTTPRDQQPDDYPPSSTASIKKAINEVDEMGNLILTLQIVIIAALQVLPQL
jgi:hypothetical protein